MLLVLVRAVFVLVVAGLGVRTCENRRRDISSPIPTWSSVAIMLAAIVVVIG